MEGCDVLNRPKLEALDKRNVSVASHKFGKNLRRQNSRIQPLLIYH